MAEPWIAELEVSVHLAKALIDQQFADMAPADVALLGSGWDNTAFTVNGNYVFRFPRRAFASALLLFATDTNDADLRREGLTMLSYLE